MKVKELRDKSKEELKNLLDQEVSKLSQIRFSAKSNQTKDYKEIKRLKKKIARILTLLKEKELNKELDNK